MATRKQIAGKISGVNPLIYTGSSPNVIVSARRPTTKDYIGYEIGTQWIIPKKANDASASDPSQEFWFLTSKRENTGVWKRLRGHGSGPSPEPLVIVTQFNTPGSSGTHILNENTVMVKVMGWGGGGAGGQQTGSVIGYICYGGSGSPFSMFDVPALFLGGGGASVNWGVGIGGNGTTGALPTSSFFGNIFCQGGTNGSTSDFLQTAIPGASTSYFTPNAGKAGGNVTSNGGYTLALGSSPSSIDYVTIGSGSGDHGNYESTSFDAGATANYFRGRGFFSSAAGGGGSGGYYNGSIAIAGNPGGAISDNNGTVLVAGGLAGAPLQAGGNGNDNNNTFFAGGSGGGGGGGASTSANNMNGGNGGWPGGGGGGGGTNNDAFAADSMPGSGGGGRLIVVEYLS